MVNFHFSTRTVEIIFKESIPRGRYGSFDAAIHAALNTEIIY